VSDRTLEREGQHLCRSTCLAASVVSSASPSLSSVLQASPGQAYATMVCPVELDPSSRWGLKDLGGCLKRMWPKTLDSTGPVPSIGTVKRSIRTTLSGIGTPRGQYCGSTQDRVSLHVRDARSIIYQVPMIVWAYSSHRASVA
jgi:hypothetical protein